MSFAHSCLTMCLTMCLMRPAAPASFLAGLKMLQSMWEAAWGVVSSQFIGNSEWLKKLSKGS